MLTLNITFSLCKLLFCMLPCHQYSLSLLLFQRIRSGLVHKDRARVLLLKEMSCSLTPEVIPAPVAHAIYLCIFSDLQDHLLNFLTVEYEHVLEAVFVSYLTWGKTDIPSLSVEEIKFKERIILKPTAIMSLHILKVRRKDYAYSDQEP